MKLITEKQRKRDERDAKIAAEFEQIMSKGGAMKMAVMTHLSDRHNVHISTVYRIISRENGKG